MQPVTVAIADSNVERRTRLERSLQEKQGITILTNIATSSHGVTRNRRRACRSGMTLIDDLVARTKRLDPRILLVNLAHCTMEQGDILTALTRECPKTRVLLLADQPELQEEQILQALAKGARGYLDFSADPILISQAARVIDCGGAWVPRKMLGKIMDQVMKWQQ